MNKAAEKEIKRIVAIIAKKHRPEKIYLFGSFAWGNRAATATFEIAKKVKKIAMNAISL